MNILFLQTAHDRNDDRVRYHQQCCLEAAGHHCSFASSAEELSECPDIAICDVPPALWTARRKWGKTVRVVYDITEWYPSKKNLRNAAWWFKPLKWLILLVANYWAGLSADAYIFGEHHKALPFRILFPWKRYIYLPYYPLLRYIPATEPKAITDTIHLLYAGPQTSEKGYDRVQQLVRLCEMQYPDKKIILTAINGLCFENFCKEITRHDIFLDLRDADPENTRCLPIKLFYYLAAGRPVIFSNLKAIRHGVPEIAHDSLINPKKLSRAAEMIHRYASDSELYLSVCRRNRNLAETHYNWDSLKDTFIHFVESL